MPSRRRHSRTDPEQVFGPVNLRRLRSVLGSASERLIPAFADAAVNFSRVQHETTAAAARRQKGASFHASFMKRLDRKIQELVEMLAVLNASLTDASDSDYVPLSAPSGTFRQLADAVAIQKLHALRKTATAVQPAVRNLRQRAEADARRKRGRKVGDRHHLASYVAERLHDAGLSVTTTKDKRLWTTLLIVYEASAIDVPRDLARDVRVAVDRLRQVR